MRRFLPLLILAASSCLRTVPEPTGACRVVVRDSEAQITFPRVTRSDWVWNRAAARVGSNVPNYAWVVYLYPGPGLHVEVSRDAHGPAAHGDLASMLRAATVVITWPSAGPSEFDSYRTVDSLHPSTADGRVALFIRDSSLLRQLFALNHPTEARCDFDADGEAKAPWVWDTVRYAKSPFRPPEER